MSPGAILVAACTSTSPTPGPATPAGIVIDGVWDDWSGIPVAAADPIGDSSVPLDIGAIRVAHDGEAVFLRIDLASEVNLQGLEATLSVAFDADGDASTGRTFAGLTGVDVILDLSPTGPDGQPTGGASIRVAGGSGSTDRTASAYDLGVVFAPSHASRRFEVHIDRGAASGAGPSFGAGPGVRAIAVVRAPGTGGDDLADVTAPVAESLPDPPERADRVAATDPLARSADGLLRVLAWNVADDGLLARPERFARILTALAPDVMLLDEISPAMTRDRLIAFLDDVGGGPWHVVLGESGGRQRDAVVSRFPLEAAPALARVAWPDSVHAVARETTNRQMISDMATAHSDGIPTTGAIASIDGTRILFVPVDFQCCGRIGNPEDRARIIQSDAIRRSIETAMAEGRAGAVVVGGDFNLVGSYTPVERIASRLDSGGGDLTVAFPLRLDGRTATTWRARGPFTPGRLDYVLFSGSSLEAVGSFVFDAGDLGERWRSEHGLSADDSENSSDHLPVVVDLRVRQPG
jgi:endonuclease/exonuclease/phosphatase family metal-dependent hydrolase